jgi:hypothetical protein
MADHDNQFIARRERKKIEITQQDLLTRAEKEDPLEYHIDHPKVKEHLGIQLRRVGEDSALDDERIYQYIISRDVEKMSKKRRNFDFKVALYEKAREIDPEYVALNAVNELGVNCDTEAVTKETIEESWRANSKPHGPLFKKRYIAWKTSLPTGPSEEEKKEARALRDQKLEWKRIQANVFVDPTLEAKRLAQLQSLAEVDANLKSEGEIKREAIKSGHFEKTRTLPSRLQFKMSLENWNKSIYKPDEWDTDCGFPSVIGLDGGDRAGSLTINDPDSYVKYRSRLPTELYVDIAKGDIITEFNDYMVALRVERARQFLKEEAEYKATEARRRELAAKLELRIKKRAEADAKAAALAEIQARKKEAAERGERSRREKMLLEAQRLIEKQLQEMGDERAERIKGKKFQIITPLEPPKTAEQMVDEALEKERILRIEALEAAEEAERLAIEAFNKTFKGRMQLVKNKLAVFRQLTAKISMSAEELEELELDKLEKEEAEKAAKVAKDKQMKNQRSRMKDIHEETKDEEQDFESEYAKQERIEKEKMKKRWYRIYKKTRRAVKGTEYIVRRALGLKIKKAKTLGEKKLKREIDLKKELLAVEKEKQIVEAIFKARHAARNDVSTWSVIKDAIRGETLEEREVWYVPDLLAAARAGDYNKCIDILEHPNSPIGPNEYEESGEGVSATYVAIEKMLKGAKPATAADRKAAALQAKHVPFWKRMARKWAKKSAEGKLDYVTKVLIHKGGDLNFVRVGVGEECFACLHTAAQLGYADIITWLLNKGADPTILTSKYQKNALMLAVERDHIDAILLLLARGIMPFINHQDHDGRTALHYASVNCCVETAQVLLICGAKQIRSKAGRMPMEEAKAAGKMEMYERLLTYKEVDLEHTNRLNFLTDLKQKEQELG